MDVIKRLWQRPAVAPPEMVEPPQAAPPPLPRPCGQVRISRHDKYGVVTSRMVDLRPKPRVMNDDMGNLVLVAVPRAAPILVVSTNDVEALAFAMQTLEWLRSRGYEKADGVSLTQFGQPIRGQAIHQNQDGSYVLFVGTVE